MDNKFIVSTCRFSTKENNKLLIAGWFEKNVIKSNRLVVVLDKNRISLTMEERDISTRSFKSKKNCTITKEYYLWIDLPKNWRKAKNLKVINISGNNKQVSYSISVSKLLKIEKIIPNYIESVVANNNGFNVFGWYVDCGNTKVQFLGADGKDYPVEIKTQKREDVEKVFLENSSEEVLGFVASYKGQASGSIKICFSSSEKYSECVTDLSNASLAKKVKKGLSKARSYYNRNGIKATVVKATGEVIRRYAISDKQWYKKHRPKKPELRAQKKHKFAFEPKISIVIPLYKTPEKYLQELITSIKAQTYSNWELCLSDGSGENSPMVSILKKYEASDKRIKVVYNKQALQISDNTNEALKIATGDYIAFTDHDDILPPHALYECVYELNQDPTIEMIYSDEDKIDMDGKVHFMPNFKSDFNMDMLCSTNYFCHLVVVRKDIFKKVGFLRSEFDGAQDFDYVLRCVEVASNIKHIPKILYHWRAHKDSTAVNQDSKSYAFKAGAQAVQSHYDRMGIPAIVEETETLGIYRTKYLIKEKPLISIIIPNKDHVDDLKRCITSLEEKNKYDNYEVIIVENNSTEIKTFEYYKELEASHSKISVVYWDGKGFNYPKINHFGVEQASGEYILFLNNDTEIINEDCLQEMVSYCMRPEVGAVGARLYFEDGTIQHAGVVIGMGGVAGHAFAGQPHNDWGYFGRIRMAQNYSAVTAACMLVKKQVFEEVGGFDERYAVAYNDVDLCLKIREAGYLIVYNPYAELYHYESKSRGFEDTEEKLARFKKEEKLFATKWAKILENGDPYYNPNLTRKRGDFSLKV